MNLSLAVGYETEALRCQAETLAAQLGLPVSNQTLPRLSVTPDKLVLLMQGCSSLYADFGSQLITRRCQAGKSLGLVRACRPQKGMRIIDATAGWGRDAAILASFGAEVTMLERNPVMVALLQDALSRLQTSTTLNLSLVSTDAVSYLQQLNLAEFPDVIYIDPMHPVRHKSALVKKDMQALQHLIGPDSAVETLLQQALMSVRHFVVVKWPQRLPPIFPAHHSIQGKTVRFDVYTRNLSKY